MSDLQARLDALSKAQLVEVVRSLTGKVGDTARTSKGEYVQQLLAMPADVVSAAMPARAFPMPASALISGAVPQLQPAAIEVPVPSVQRVGKKTLGELFGIRGKFADFEVSVWNDPAAPKFDPKYVFDAAKLHSFATSVERGRAPWLGGPSGTGKTEFVKNFCAATGRYFCRVSLESGIERYDLIGGERARAGTLVYQDGIVLRAYRRPGSIILLDEVSFGRPEYLAALHPALEPEGAVTIAETGEVVHKAPGVVFAAADNSNGRGDSSGVYSGIREQNLAFLNRFSKFITFEYLPADREAKVIVARVEGCPPALADVIVNFLRVCRQSAQKAEIDSPPSLREAMYLAEALLDGQDYREAFEECIANRATSDVYEQLQQLWKANVNEEAIRLALTGKASAQAAAKTGAGDPLTLP